MKTTNIAYPPTGAFFGSRGLCKLVLKFTLIRLTGTLRVMVDQFVISTQQVGE